MARRFDHLGDVEVFLSVIEHTCVQAATMQDTLAAHDARVLALLKQRQQPHLPVCA